MRGNSSIAVSFDNVRLESDALIGQPGGGAELVFGVVAPAFLIGLAAVNVGIAQAAVSAAIAHAADRRYPDGTTLAEMPTIQQALADMDLETRSARALVRQAARLADDGDESALVVVMEAKVHATDTGPRVTQQALEVCGGQGYTPALPIERHLRDARAGAAMAPTNAVYSNYERLVEAALAGSVDIGWNTSTAFVRLDHEAGGRTRIHGMRDVDLDWSTVLVTGRDRPLDGVGDLAGRVLALGSRDSGHAAILPLHYLAQEGLDAAAQCELLRFDTDIGKHGDTGDSELHVVRAVAEGKADAGVLSAAYFSAFRADGLPDVADLEVSWGSPPYYHCNFTVLDSFDRELGERWSQILLAMDYDDESLRPAMDLEGVRTWHPGEEAGYESLRSAMWEQGLLS